MSERPGMPHGFIRDSREKMAVVRQGRHEPDVDNIGIVPARDFFLGD